MTGLADLGAFAARNPTAAEWRSLGNGGAPVVRALRPFLSTRFPSGGLSPEDVLAMVRGDGVVEALTDLARARVADGSAAAVRALGRVATPEAVAVLCELLTTQGIVRAAADALRDAGHSAAIPALAAALDRLVAEDPLNTIRDALARGESLDAHCAISVGAALAWLGDDRFAGPLLDLASPRTGFPLSLRIEAARSLTTLDPSVRVIRALLELQRDECAEIAIGSMIALARVGLVGVVPHWIALLEDGPRDREREIGIALDELLGERAPRQLFECIADEPPEPDALRAWWEALSPTFHPDRCVWHGALASPALALAQLARNGSARDVLARWTGIEFLDTLPPRGADGHELMRAEAWWREHGPTWSPGELRHKGHHHDADALAEALRRP